MASLLRNFNKIYSNGAVSARLFSRNTVKFCEKDPHILTHNMHKVNNLERRILVWAGKFKTMEEVPAMVSPEMIEKARNRFRIRLANYMMVGTLFACLVMVISGKRASERGESVSQANMEWHRRLKHAEDVTAEEHAKH